MEKTKLSELAAWAGSSYAGGETITLLSTDSRQIPPGCLFVALAGESFDGHAFVGQALEKGAVAALVHRPVPGVATNKLIQVTNTQQALLDIAGHYRSQFHLALVAVTGSVGKTTTKDMIACLLSAAMPTLKTQGNFNNEIGMPKTLLELTPAHRAAVIEMGMSAPGEIATLAGAAKPDIGVITNIGLAHIEQLGSRENILKAKLELADALPPGAPLILCADNDLLATVQRPELKVVRYGTSDSSLEVYGHSVEMGQEDCRFIIRYQGSDYPAHLPAAGQHNLLNALAAFAVGQQLGLAPKLCTQALEDYTPSAMRQHIVHKNDMVFVVDCYNASPDSMAAALQTLAQYQVEGRRVAVLADMLELGSHAPQSHYGVGQQAAKAADALFCWGEQAAQYAAGATAAGMQNVYHFIEKQKLIQALQGYAAPGDVLWFKASRGMKLEEVAKALGGLD